MTYEMVEAVTFIISCILSVTGLMLLLHHGYKHMNDAPGTLVKQASCAECLFFQILDTSNHETWILLCWSNAITTLVVSVSSLTIVQLNLMEDVLCGWYHISCD